MGLTDEQRGRRPRIAAVVTFFVGLLIWGYYLYEFRILGNTIGAGIGSNPEKWTGATCIPAWIFMVIVSYVGTKWWYQMSDKVE